MSSAPANELAWLLAHEHIRGLIARYARAGDLHNNAEQMAALFTADASWEAQGFGRFEGRDTIVEQLAKIGREQITWSLHFPAMPVIELDQSLTSARAIWSLWEVLTMNDNGEQKNQWMAANYDSRITQTDGSWRFQSLTLTIQKMIPFTDPEID